MLYSTELVLKIIPFESDNAETAISTINKFIDSIANSGNNTLNWQEVDFNLTVEDQGKGSCPLCGYSICKPDCLM
jgi:hypothetical protein